MVKVAGLGLSQFCPPGVSRYCARRWEGEVVCQDNSPLSRPPVQPFSGSECLLLMLNGRHRIVWYTIHFAAKQSSCLSQLVRRSPSRTFGDFNAHTEATDQEVTQKFMVAMATLGLSQYLSQIPQDHL